MKFKLLTGLLIAPVVVPLGISFSNHSSQNQNVVLSDKKTTNDVLWSITDDGTISPIDKKVFSGLVTIPEAFDGITVKKIDNSAFFNNDKITGVIIPDTVTTIGNAAFQQTGLESVTIPDSVTEIGSGAFYWCGSLSSINIPSQTTKIGNDAFFAVPFTNITLDSNNQTFEWRGTENNGYIVRKDAEDKYACPTRLAVGRIDLTGATIIHNEAFSFCRGITMFYGMENITEIQYEAFRFCTGLNSFTIPKKTKTLGEGCLQQLSTIGKIIFENDDINSINFAPRHVFWRTSPRKIQINAGINYLDNEQQTLLFNTFINKLNSIGFETTIDQYTTWYDNSTTSPSGYFYVFNLNTQATTTIGSGFKAWRDEKSDTRTVALEYTTSDNNINVTGTIDDNLSIINTTITGNVPNIYGKHVTFTPRLHLRDSSNNFDKTVGLESGIIRLKANINITTNDPVFHEDNRINVSRDNGLWFGNDFYITNTQINKAYFGEHWNDKEYIKNNLSTYFKFTNNSGTELSLIKNNNYWFNNQLGVILININTKNFTTYTVTFAIAKGNGNDIATLIDQNINCYLKPWAKNKPIFSIQTYSANKFKPNRTFSDNGSNVNLSLNNQTQRTTWNLDNQTIDSQIAKNDFDWYQRQGYSFRLDASSFNNQFIGIGDDLTLNDDKTQFSVSVNLRTPNINAVNVNVSGLKVIAYKSGVANVEFNLPTFNVNASNNDNHSINKNHLNKSTEISNTRDGLWINGDTYDTRVVVNKAYFGQNWNNPNYIKNNFNQYINVSGNGETYQFNHADNTNVYTNPKIGQMNVTGVDQDTDPNSYLIKLWFSVPDSVDYQLLDQTITFDLKNAPSGSDHLFTINTCDKNQFDPNYNNFRANNINLTSGQRSGTIVWNDSDQTQFKNLGNTNTCKWAISKGYTLSVEGFSDQYIMLDSNATFDVNSNTLQVGVTQAKFVTQETSVNVSGLKLNIMNGSTVVRQDITLPNLTITLGAASTDITTTNLTYTSVDQKSLRDKGDTASFDLTIPEVLKPENDAQLINKFNFAYKGEGQSTWTWKPVPSETGIYKFQYQHDDETYTLTYQLVTNLQSDINPRYTYHITLTQEFDGKVKKDIEFSFVGASSSNPFEINADEWQPTLNLGAILGGVFGAIVLIGLIALTVVLIKRRKNK
ncbi:MAG: leucine-rich repeat domain-containing protein [Mycoplasma sp.]